MGNEIKPVSHILKKPNPLSKHHLNSVEEMVVETRQEDSNVDNFVPIFDLDYESEELDVNEKEINVLKEWKMKGKHSAMTDANNEANAVREATSINQTKLASSASED